MRLTNMENDLLTINQVATILQVSRATVYVYINQKENPLPLFYLSERTPRVKRSELDLWVATHNVAETDTGKCPECGGNLVGKTVGKPDDGQVCQGCGATFS